MATHKSMNFHNSHLTTHPHMNILTKEKEHDGYYSYLFSSFPDVFLFKSIFDFFLFLFVFSDFSHKIINSAIRLIDQSISAAFFETRERFFLSYACKTSMLKAHIGAPINLGDDGKSATARGGICSIAIHEFYERIYNF